MITVGYIISPAYSGSTLLSMMLGAHSQILTTGESHGGAAMWEFKPQIAREYICSCGVPVIECPFFNEVAERVARKGVVSRFPNLGLRHRWTHNPKIYRLLNGSMLFALPEWLRYHGVRLFPPTRAMLKRVGRNNVTVMGEMLEMTGKSVFVDASKAPVRCENLAEVPGLDVRPILLTRDGRATAVSVRKRSKDSFENGLQSWNRFMHTAKRALKRTGKPYFHVRYEDLCAKPDDTMNRLHTFLGLEPEGWPPPDGLPDYHVLGNDMRMKFTTQLRQPDPWEDKISPQELAFYQREAGAMGRELGYHE